MRIATFEGGTMAAVCLAAFAAAASAEDRLVPSHYPTIDEALAASSSGDRIVVGRGRWPGVDLTAPGVTLVGRGATLTGDVRIEAPRVTLSGFTVGAGAHVVVRGDDAVVERNVFRPDPMGDPVISVEGGARATIVRNRTRRGSVVVSSGQGAVLRSNVFDNSSIAVLDSYAVVELNSGRDLDIAVVGNGIVVRGNKTGDIHAYIGTGATIERNRIGWRFVSMGDEVRIAGNRVRGDFSVVGDDVQIRSNRLSRSTNGVRVRGNRAVVVGNTVESSPRYVSSKDCPNMHMPAYESFAIDVVATEPGGTIEGNRITHATGFGISVSVNGATISDNVVVGTSSLSSIAVIGSDNALTGNDVTQGGLGRLGGNGIEVNGDTNVIGGNHVTGAIADGIAVQTGTDNSVLSNVVDDGRGCGVLVSYGAAGTVVSDCTVTGCAVGFANAGTGTSTSDSAFTDSRFADVVEIGSFLLFRSNTFDRLSHDAELVFRR